MEKHHSSERDALVQLSQEISELKEGLSDEQKLAKLFELSVSICNCLAGKCLAGKIAENSPNCSGCLYVFVIP